MNTVYHEMGHYIFWSDAERKADTFALRMERNLSAQRQRHRSGACAQRARRAQGGMSDEPEDGAPPAVKDRWWVETRRQAARARRAAGVAPAPPVGSKFYRSGIGFNQETARSRLTDLNLKLLMQANPPEGGWGYVQLAETTFPERERERDQGADRAAAATRAACWSTAGDRCAYWSPARRSASAFST